MVDILRETYAVLSELWCNPADVDTEALKEKAYGIAHMLADINEEAPNKLAQFLETYPPTEEYYIEVFELSPKCPLYLGSYLFEEPKTCAQAGVSERNDYMIDILGIYKHFGLGMVEKELPDFLPLMLEFLSITADKREDKIRRKFIEEYMMPALEPMKEKVKEVGAPHLLLLDLLEELLKFDLSYKEVRS